MVRSETDAEDSVLSVNQYCSHVTTLTTPTQPHPSARCVSPHFSVLLGLALLQSLVIVCLQLDQQAEYDLVLVGILVAGGGEREGRGEGGRRARGKKEMKEKKYAEIREREKYTCTCTLYSLLSLPPSLPPSPSPPVHVLKTTLLGAGMAAQQHHDGVTLGRNEAQQEHVPVPTVVALQYGLPQRTVFVECDLLTASPDQVVDYVTVEGRVGEGGGGGGGRRRREEEEEEERGGETDAEDSVLSVNQYCSHVTILTTPT